MEISLFALGAEVTPSVKAAQELIENAFLQLFHESYAFQTLTSEKTFLAELSTAVASDDIIVAAAEPAYYKAFKNFMFNAFSMKSRPVKDVSSVAAFAHPELDPDFISEQSLMPASGIPLLTQDGLYSGFGVKAKKQLLIVLPLDDIRLEYLIENSLLDYIRANVDASLMVFESGEEPSSAPKPREPDRLYDEELIRRVAEKLEADEFSIALANTKTVDFVGTVSTTAVDLSRVVFISDYTVSKGELSAREYAVNLAKGALENSSNDLGGALTKVFSRTGENGEPQYFIYVCIADEENANAAKLVAEPGETPPQLIYRAIEELFRMIDLWMETGYALPQSGTPVVRPGKKKKQKNSKVRGMKYFFGAALGGSLLLSLAVSFLATDIYHVM